MKKWIVLAFLGFLSVGCNSMGGNVWLEKVKFRQAEDMNSNSPVTVDIVIVYSKDIMDELIKLPADKYFEQKEQLKKDLPDQIEIFSFEATPGQRLRDQDIDPKNASGVGALIFAQYSTPGAHRVALGQDRVVLVELDKLDFKTTPVEE